MAMKDIGPTDVIEVGSLAICIYGPPGVGKTALAQTAANPVTLDVDRGAGRVKQRKRVLRFDSWADIDGAWPVIAQHDTVVVDTAGRMLDMIAADIMGGDVKAGTTAKGLSIQGYGVLKARFAMWNARLWQAGKTRIYIAHEKEEKDGDDRIFRPDMQGGSYNELHKSCDLMGRLYRDRSGKRMLDFNPSDRHIGKNAVGWPAFEVPDLHQQTDWLAQRVAEAMAVIGKVAEQSASVARDVEDWKAQVLAADTDVAAFNAIVPGLAALKGATKVQCKAITVARAKEMGWTWSKEGARYVDPLAVQPVAANGEADGDAKED